MNAHPVPGVGVAVVDRGELLVVQRGREPGLGRWAIPGGRVELGERLVDAARREALEETGLDVEIGPVVWVGESIGPGDPPAWHYALVDFLGSVRGGELRAGDDARDVRWVGLDRIDELDVVPTMAPLVSALRSRL